MLNLKPLSVVYGEYGLNTGFRTRVEMIGKLLQHVLGTKGEWLTFERGLKAKTVQVEDSRLLVRMPRSRSVLSLFRNCFKAGLSRLPGEVGGPYDLVIAHSFNSMFVSLALKKRFGIPLLLDAHGLWAEEVLSWSGKNNSIKENYLNIVEKNIIASADGLIYASNSLREFLVDKYKFLEKKPGAVIHCAVDTGEFRFDPEARQRLRKEWDWEDKTVIIHSGINAPWVDIQGIMHLIKMCCVLMPETRFLFLAGDPCSWKEVYNFIEDSNKIKILSVNHSDIPLYLSAADIGLLARINSPINRVSCPTKISEYLAIGLPILMTRGIDDYDQYLREFNLGAVIPYLAKIDSELPSIIKGLQQIKKEMIIDWCKQNLSLFNYDNAFYILLNSIAKGLK
ncbi:MAG: glycosyltransferase [Clostridia bacterium]|nr:glycosyltransferase [Clostridia bacterium]